MWSRVQRPAQVLFLALALVFIALLVRNQWDELQRFEWRLLPGPVALAFAALAASWAVEISLWRFILLRLSPDSPLPWGRAAQIWLLSNIVRYVPGNVWQFLGMVSLAHEAGIARKATLTSIVLHQVLVNLAGLLLALAAFAWLGETALMRTAALPVVLAVLALALRPRWLERPLNWALARLGRAPLHVALHGREMLALTLAYTLVWLALGAGFTALATGLAPLPAQAWPLFIASFAAAYVLGYLSLLTPSGLGVREGALVLLLQPMMPAGAAAVLAILARLWIIAGELAGAALALATWPGLRAALRRQAPAQAGGE